ncbi:unnamed protein product, partial [Iphiclides podalirius]
MSASCIIATSLPPSPTAATTCPRARSSRATRAFCVGEQRATTTPAQRCSTPTNSSSYARRHTCRRYTV